MSTFISSGTMRRLPRGCSHRSFQVLIQTRWNSTVTASHTKLSGEKEEPIPRDSISTQQTVATQHPLSIMPTTMLLRSVLTSTVSSNRWLLLPSLSILSWLSKPGRTWLLNIDKNPMLHGFLKKAFYDQFCAGETEQQTKSCVRQLKDLGFRGVILTYAREIVFDHSTNKSHGMGCSTEEGGKVVTKVDAEIEAWRVGTLKTLDLVDEGDILALKTTGAGPAVASAFTNARLPSEQMLTALREIATLCKTRGVQIIIDAESQHFQKGINLLSLALMQEFNTDGHAVIYNTYQAYLKSTPSVVAEHLSAALQHNFTLGLKLVRGAYIYSDARHLIHDTKQETDDAYNSITHGVLQQSYSTFGAGKPSSFPSVNLFIASHNRESVISAQRLHQQRKNAGLPTVPVAFGQLHGMSDSVSFALLQEKGGVGAEEKPRVFKCSTWGSMGECVGYLVRRAVENRDAASRTSEELSALRGEVWRRMRGVFGLGK